MAQYILTIVIIDEVYVDFGAESAADLIPKYDNLIVVGTFSKSRSMAGIRIGYALGQESLISDLHRIKYSFNPYSLDGLAVLAGKASVASYVQVCESAPTITFPDSTNPFSGST